MDDLAVLEVRFHDFIHIVGIYIGIPGSLGVHHSHGAGCAAVQATRLVHPHLAGARQPSGLDLIFAPIKRLLGAVVGTTVFAVGTVVQAKKKMWRAK